jgi:hypothetical protein
LEKRAATGDVHAVRELREGEGYYHPDAASASSQWKDLLTARELQETEAIIAAASERRVSQRVEQAPRLARTRQGLERKARSGDVYAARELRENHERYYGLESHDVPWTALLTGEESDALQVILAQAKARADGTPILLSLHEPMRPATDEELSGEARLRSSGNEKIVGREGVIASAEGPYISAYEKMNRR